MRFIVVNDAVDDLLLTPARYPIIRSYHSEVSQAIEFALEDSGHLVTQLQANQGLPQKLVTLLPDFAFNCSSQSKKLERRAYAPWILKKMGIPFTGSGSRACFDAYDKIRTKRILQKAGIRTPQAVVLSRLFLFYIPRNMKFPLFVKPVRGGCSFGINSNSLIADQKTLRERLPEFIRQFDQPMLLEEFLPGREFTVGVLGNRVLQVLPIMEFGSNQLNSQAFRSYSLKMAHCDQEEKHCPADLKPEQKEEIENMARMTFRALGCRDYARIDFRMDCAGQPYVLEVNALPNLIPETSSYAIMAREGGLSFKALIDTILRTAQARYSMLPA